MNTKYYIGCSGFYYSAWRGHFYPSDVKPKDWLHYYNSILNTVELNGTFYRQPKLADLKKYYAATDSSFRFSVKMSKYVSHIKRLKDCAQQIRDFHVLIEEGLHDKLACILYQMPPSFHHNDDNIERVMNIPSSPNNVIEFRHASWWNEEVYALLRKHNITMCNVDLPDMPVPIADTSINFYMRMHGNPILFKSEYDMNDLIALAKAIPAHTSNNYIYFNNTYFDAGYTNAAQLKQLLGID
ncbi:MAG: DUF72 domain-containing protein [Bacteroidetes bacterium]|nr:DUF72 domain-containing protein [Bacteroidota bacterium]